MKIFVGAILTRRPTHPVKDGSNSLNPFFSSLVLKTEEKELPLPSFHDTSQNHYDSCRQPSNRPVVLWKQLFPAYGSVAKQPKSMGFFDNLPDNVLCHILSFLPTKDAARTSVLSPRWRYLFVSSISEIDFKPCITTCKRDDNFLDFVDRFFSSPKLVTLECFRVHDFWINYDPSEDDRRWADDYLRINGWLCAAVRRGVKEIVIFSVKKKNPPLPTTLLFTCQSLVTLKLKIRGVNGVPTNACLPNLKTLHFTFFKFLDVHSVLKLISSCPVLEDLGFFRCRFRNISELHIHSLSLKRLVLDFGMLSVNCRRGFNVIKIDAPNLVYFKYANGMAEECTLSEMKSLERADIQITEMDNDDRECAANLLRGVCNVQSLYLGIEDSPRTVFLAPLDPMLAFYNLVELEFCNKFNDAWQGTWIVELLRCMPNLRTISLELARKSGGFESLPAIVPSCLLFRIKEIEIKYFDGKENMFGMVSYFLKHASVMEKLIIRRIDVCEEQPSTIVEKLLSLPKESKKCEIMTP